MNSIEIHNKRRLADTGTLLHIVTALYKTQNGLLYIRFRDKSYDKSHTMVYYVNFSRSFNSDLNSD